MADADKPELTPEQLRAALEGIAKTVGEALSVIWYAFQPFFDALAKLAATPEFQAEWVRRELLAGRALPARPSGCHCLCGYVHRGIHVCDGEPVTTVHRWSQLTGPVEVPTCAPCAAEVMAQAVNAVGDGREQ